jgi:hypothetical protein
MAADRGSNHGGGSSERGSGHIPPRALAGLSDEKVAKSLLGPEERKRKAAQQRSWLDWLKWWRTSDNC